MFDHALAAFDTLDILMNNSGMDASGKPVAELPTETFDRAIRTNLYGPRGLEQPITIAEASLGDDAGLVGGAGWLRAIGSSS